MKKAEFGLFCALLCGCGSDDDEVKCDPAARSGQYLAEYQETSGNCGPVFPHVIEMPSPDYLPVGCTLDEPDRWSSDQCTLTRHFTCTAEGYPLDDTAIFVRTTKTDPTADVITGTESLTSLDGTNVQCEGSYAVKYTRQ